MWVPQASDWFPWVPASQSGGTKCSGRAGQPGSGPLPGVPGRPRRRTDAPRPPFPTAACNLPIVTGPCRGYNQLWAFDAVQGKCVLFTYGGCQGNGNKFYSEKECREYCGVPGNGRRTRGCYWVQAGEPW